MKTRILDGRSSIFSQSKNARLARPRERPRFGRTPIANYALQVIYSTLNKIRICIFCVRGATKRRFVHQKFAPKNEAPFFFYRFLSMKKVPKSVWPQKNLASRIQGHAFMCTPFTYIRKEVYSTCIYTHLSPVALYTHLFRFKVSFDSRCSLIGKARVE